jgi:hypothetical protein
LAEVEQPPEKWIGEQVYVGYWTGDKRSGGEGTLQSVGDRGITVFLKEETRFFPWQAVLEIAPMSERKTRRPMTWR